MGHINYLYLAILQMMNNKYNASELTQYSRELARKLADSYFKDNKAITGPELMKFSPVRQVNLFVVKELLGRWHAEMANLRSPYFDFEAEPVKESLAQFMNELSQHIKVERAAFEPLLASAIEQALVLAHDPAVYFSQGFLPTETEVQTEKLRSNLRYLDQARPLYTDFLSSLHAPSHNRDFLEQRFKLYLNAHPNEQQPAAGLLSELDKLMPLPAAQPQTPVSAAPAPPEPKPETPPTPAPVVASTPSPAPVTEPAKPTEAPKAAPVAPQVQPPVPQPAPAAAAKPVSDLSGGATSASEPQKPAPAPAPVQTPKPAEAPKPAPTPAAVQAAPQPAKPLSTAEAPKNTLHDKLKQERTTLNETLRKPAAPTLADSMGDRKIESLKSSISINQRFAFINELFGGDGQAYHAAIEQLDMQPTMDEARDFVLTDLTRAYAWTNHTEHVNKLLRLVERKFAS